MGILVASEANEELIGLNYRLAVVKDLIALVVLTILPALFFWRFLTPDVIDAVTLPSGDLTNLNYPYRLFETRELLQGHLPQWNPYVFSGTSSLGDIQYGVFYPVNILCSLLLGSNGFAPVDLAIQIAIHFSLAAVFTYLFAKQIIGNRTGAMVSALVFTYSGYLTSFPVQQIMILETSIWLPLILLFIDRGITRRSLPSFTFAAVFAAVAISVGHPQTFMYVFIGVLAYAVFKLWIMAAKKDLVTIAGIAVFLFLSFGLAAAQLVPSYEHLQLTERTTVNYEFVQHGFLLRELVGLLFPTVAGGRFMYVGILPLLLTVIAILAKSDLRQKLFWFVLAGLALIFSFGGQTFLHTAAYMVLPGFKFFRDQERFVFLFSFGVAMLSGYGVRAICDELSTSNPIFGIRQRVIDHGNWLRWLGLLIAAFSLAAFLSYAGATGEQKKTLAELSDRAIFTLVIFVVSAVILHAGARQAVRPILLTLMLVGVVAFDLFSSNWRNNVELAKPAELYPVTKTVSTIKADRGEVFRISSEGLLPGHGNAGIIYQLEDIVGDSPLELHQHLAFEKDVDEIRRWQLLNVKYILTKRKFEDSRFIPVMQEDQINTYQLAPNLRLPRAYIVHKAVIAPTEDEALRATKTIDPHDEVVLSSNTPFPLPAQPSNESKVTITSKSATGMELDTSSTANGVLVLSEVFSPGWKAFVDGQSVEILRADYLLRAIPIESGSHTVKLVYEPSSLNLGTTISLMAALAAIAVILAATLLSLVSKRVKGQAE